MWMVVFSACSIISTVVSMFWTMANIATGREWHEKGAGGACFFTFTLLLATFIAWVCFVVKLYKAGSLLRTSCQPPPP